MASKEAMLHIALDNMPGALVYTDRDLNVVVCNDRFAEMYPVPRELLLPGGRIPNFFGSSPNMGTTATATLPRWSHAASTACAIRATRPSRTARPMVASTGSRDVVPRPVAQ
ncbi:MAG TPA: PAS-domain containing protein [Casimicrobiaceae bacterium]